MLGAQRYVLGVVPIWDGKLSHSVSLLLVKSLLSNQKEASPFCAKNLYALQFVQSYCFELPLLRPLQSLLSAEKISEFNTVNIWAHLAYFLFPYNQWLLLLAVCLELKFPIIVHIYIYFKQNHCITSVSFKNNIVINSLNNIYNHNYNKILKSDWLSTALISALIGQYASCLSNWTVRAITRALKWLFFHWYQKNLGISCVLI